MYRALLPLACLLVAAAPASADDPYLWLEEIEGPKALAQVKEWNGQTEAALTAMPGYEEYRSRARAILDDEQQIALPEDVDPDRVHAKYLDGILQITARLSRVFMTHRFRDQRSVLPFDAEGCRIAARIAW